MALGNIKEVAGPGPDAISWMLWFLRSSSRGWGLVSPYSYLALWAVLKHVFKYMVYLNLCGNLPMSPPWSALDLHLVG